MSEAPREFFFDTLGLPLATSYFAGSISEDVFGLAAEGEWVGPGTSSGLFQKPLKQVVDATFADWVENSFKTLVKTAPVGQICTIYGKECYCARKGTKYSTTTYVLRSSTRAIFFGPVSTDPLIEPGKSCGVVLAEYHGDAAWKKFQLLDLAERIDNVASFGPVLESGWENLWCDVSDIGGDISDFLNE